MSQDVGAVTPTLLAVFFPFLLVVGNFIQNTRLFKFRGFGCLDHLVLQG